jgi:hypothetical protein
MGIIYDTPIFKRLLSLLPVKFLHISLTKSEYAEIHTWFVGYNCSNSLFTINPSPRWRVCDVTAEILNSTIFAIKKMNWEFLVELRSHYEFIAKKNPARHKSCSTSTYPEESIFRVATDSVWRDDKSCRRWGPRVQVSCTKTDPAPDDEIKTQDPLQPNHHKHVAVCPCTPAAWLPLTSLRVLALWQGKYY